MFCVPELVFGGTEGVGFSFHVLRSRTRYRRYRGRRAPFSFFTLSDPFLAVPRVLVLVFMYCALGLIFSDIEGVESHFHVLRSRNYFRRYRGRLVQSSCFALPNSFSAVRRASGPVFMFCAPQPVLGGTAGTRSYFYVLRSMTYFSKVPRASGPIFMFCAPGLFFGGSEGVGSRFHVLRSRNLFRRCATLFRASHRPEKELDDELRKKDTEIPLSVHWGIFI
jgi:hypothetical protein